jgi:hypothetical protein
MVRGRQISLAGLAEHRESANIDHLSKTGSAPLNDINGVGVSF